MNTKLKTKTITNGAAGGESDEESETAARRMKQSVAKVERFSKISDEIAQSDHWIRNEPIPFALELFPAINHDWKMRYSDLYYPKVGKNGNIWIDTPGSQIELMMCEKKLEAYRKKGVRYTYIKDNEDASAALMRLDPILPKGTRSVHAMGDSGSGRQNSTL